MPQRKKVLIVDDEVDYITILKDRLEFEGYDVLEALDGTSGLKAMKESKVDVVLLDIMMPEMDGFEVLKRIKEDGELATKPPVIFVTAYGRVLTDEQKEFISDVPFIRKPFDVKELLELINQVTS